MHTATDLRDNITRSQVYEAINSPRILMTAEVFAQHICCAHLLQGLCLKANETATVFISFGRAMPLPHSCLHLLDPWFLFPWRRDSPLTSRATGLVAENSPSSFPWVLGSFKGS